MTASVTLLPHLPETLAVERTLSAIAKETDGLSLLQRVAVEAALWRLVEEVSVPSDWDTDA